MISRKIFHQEDGFDTYAKVKEAVDEENFTYWRFLGDTYTETEKQQEKWKLNVLVVAVVSMAMISLGKL